MVTTETQLDKMINWCVTYKQDHLILILEDGIIELMERELLKRGFIVHTFIAFNDPEQGVFIEEDLKKLMGLPKGNHVVLTNRIGGRGVDFNFGMVAIVMIGFIP